MIQKINDVDSKLWPQSQKNQAEVLPALLLLVLVHLAQGVLFLLLLLFLLGAKPVPE